MQTRNALFLVFLITLLAAAAFRRGLFFDRDGYALQIVIFLSAGAALIYSLKSRRPLFPALTWALLPLGMAVLYALKLGYHPASAGATINELLRWTFYGCFLWLAALYGQRPRGREAMNWLLPWVGIFVTGGAWLGFYGVLDFPNIVVYTDDRRLSEAGFRLSGFFQYANMLAAVLSALFLFHTAKLSALRCYGWKLWLLALPQVPYVTALLLTESRGGWIAAAAGWIIGLMCTPARDKIRYAMFSLLPAVCAAVAYREILREMQMDMLYPGLPLLLSVTLAYSAAAVLGTLRVTAKPQSKPLILTSILLIGLVLFAAIVPDSTVQRAGGHYETAAARKLFYLDAWTMLQESPWTGGGGNTWANKYTRFQQQPYVGTEVHSGYIDILLDLGWTGFLFFIGMLFYFLYRIVRRSLWLAAPAVVLLLHAAIDFDMSFGFYWLFLFSMVAIGGTDVIAKPSEFRNHPASAKANVLIGLLLIGITAAGVYSVRFEAGQVALTSANPGEGSRFTALRYNPYDTANRLRLAERMPLEQGLRLLYDGLSYEPDRVSLLWKAGTMQAQLHRWHEAVPLLSRAVELDRYDTQKQEEYIQLLYQGALQLRSRGDEEQARQLAQAAVRSYLQYETLAKALSELPNPANGRKFHLTQQASFLAEQCASVFGIPLHN
ncbi:O-antigen ligase family protein [Paenibacillus gansuensis]|uniref:O-antigen ligase family protein n=1 Tax=Paenibacillus gansuensis TaxID=306542 RepID=A0ABW5PJM9_9BACL